MGVFLYSFTHCSWKSGDVLPHRGEAVVCRCRHPRRDGPRKWSQGLQQPVYHSPPGEPSRSWPHPSVLFLRRFVPCRRRLSCGTIGRTVGRTWMPERSSLLRPQDVVYRCGWELP